MVERVWTVEDHLRDRPRSSVELYERLVRIVEGCGPFTYSVAKTAITFKGTRRGFAGCVVRASGLAGYLDLQRVVVDPRISRATPYTKRLFVHHFRIGSAAELDEEFTGWVHEAYAVGQGAHLNRTDP